VRRRGSRGCGGWLPGAGGVSWPNVEEDEGHYGHLRHCSDVSLFHNGNFVKPFCGVAKE
jgi:hypothetical protein